MADKYRASVRNVLGQAVAMVEVEIKRTLFIDAHVWQQIETRIGRTGDGEQGGMDELKRFWQTASALPPEAMPYFSMPWTESDAQDIAMMPLVEIAKMTDQTTYFRVEGSPDGYTGIFNVGGKDRRIDMSLAGMPTFYALVDETIANTQAQEASGQISPAEAKTIKDFCDATRQTGGTCEKAMSDKLRWQHERDRTTRDQIGHDVKTSDFGTVHETHRGDFGPGVGHDMGGHA